MFEHNTALENAIHFSRFDPQHPLSTYSIYPFILEEQSWQTMEQYYQVQKFSGLPYAEKIQSAKNAEEAHALGNKWLKKKRADFSSVRRVLMTRAAYSKAIQNEDVKRFLLETKEELLVETSAYGHYWGLGRDQRGENILGKLWMDVRQKIMQSEDER